jgi:hypothetical protein
MFVAAVPPDVRRGFASPLRGVNPTGYAPGSGLARFRSAKGRTGGTAPKL